MRNPLFSLSDMHEALIRMIEVTSDLQLSDFSQNWVLLSAVRDQVMILGEASKQVPDEICEKYPDIPCSQLARTRDQLIHGYFKTDPQLLFSMATIRAKILLPVIKQIIKDVQLQQSDMR